MRIASWEKKKKIAVVLCFVIPFFSLLISVFYKGAVFSSKQPEEIHREALVLDAHNDLLLWLTPPHDLFPWEAEPPQSFLPVLNLNQDLDGITRYGHIDLSKLKEGGLDVPFFAVFSSERYARGRSLDKALAQVYAFHYNMKGNREKIAQARTLGDIEKLTRKGKIAAVLTVEGADYIEEPGGKELLHQLYDLGVKVLAPTWNYSNELAEGLYSEHWNGRPSPDNMGLTAYGENIVQKMNDLGMIIDVSHLHENSFWDVLEKTRAPVIASHSSASGVREHPRNLSDEQLKALAENGGVIHIAFVPDFLTPENKTSSVESIVDHIDYVVDLVGVEHVGVGSDFDGAPMPPDIDDASDLPLITEELVRRGYKEKEINKILGGNTLSILKETEKISLKDKEVIDGAGIWPEFEMGESFASFKQELNAVLSMRTGNIMEKEARCILNGREYPVEFLRYRAFPRADFKAVTLSAEFQESSFDKGFNAVTFEIKDGEGATKRCTSVVHIDAEE